MPCGSLTRPVADTPGWAATESPAAARDRPTAGPARWRRAGWRAWSSRSCCRGRSPARRCPRATSGPPPWCAIEATVTTRPCASTSSAGSSSPVSTKWARWLVPNCSSKPSSVRRRLGGAITPALLTSRSSGPVELLGELAHGGHRGEVEARGRTSAAGGVCPDAPRGGGPALRVAAGEHHPRPARARRRATCQPMPELAPVTTATRSVRSGGRCMLRPTHLPNVRPRRRSRGCRGRAGTVRWCRGGSRARPSGDAARGAAEPAAPAPAGAGDDRARRGAPGHPVRRSSCRSS